MWKGEFKVASPTLLVGPKRKGGDVDEDEDVDDKVVAVKRIDLSLAKPKKRKKSSPFESFLLKQDSALQLAFKPLENTANLALNIKRLTALGNLEPWRFHNIGATTADVGSSVAAFLFSNKVASEIVEKIADNFDAIFNRHPEEKSAIVTLLYTKIFKYEVTSRYATDRQAFQRAALWLVLTHFSLTEPIKNVLQLWWPTIGKPPFVESEDVVTTLINRAWMLFRLLDQQDEPLGIVRWFDSAAWLPDLGKVMVLAFADDKTRAALCSSDKAMHALCRAKRGNIAEIQFVYLFGASPAYEEKVRGMRQKMFGGAPWGSGREWDEFYRACVVAYRLIQENDANLDQPGAAVKKMWQMFSNESAQKRLELRLGTTAKLTDAPTREDRRFRTARVLIWMLFDRGFLDTAEYAFKASFGLFAHSSAGDYHPEDVLNDDGTVYDGSKLIDKLTDGKLPALRDGTARHSLPVVRVAYAQNSTKALWFPIDQYAGSAVETFLGLAFMERDDFTSEEKTQVAKNLAHAIADAANQGDEEVVQAVLERTKSLDIWMPVFAQMCRGDASSYSERKATLILPILATMTADDNIRYVAEMDTLVQFLAKLISHVMTLLVPQHETVASFYDARPDPLLWLRVMSRVADSPTGRASARALYAARHAKMSDFLKKRIEAFGAVEAVAADSDSD